MQAKISLTPSMVQEFVNIASRCDFDIDIAGNNRYFVDAKSYVGVMGLDLSKTLTVRYYGCNAEFERYLKTHTQAC